MKDRHTVLAILDWGLGHASRCIPLVTQLLAEGERITLASSGHALAFLREAFPQLPIIDLPSYNIRYPRQNMVWNMAIQSPKVARTVWCEARILRQFLQKHPADRIISDGRFGCYHPSCENIWLAHQLQIQHPNRLLAKAMNGLYHPYIRQRFNSVWVPDWDDEHSIAGALSHEISQLPHRYLGPLSRFSQEKKEETSLAKYDYLALLSGPEPQRTYLETEIKAIVEQTEQSCLIVRGVPGSTHIRQLSGAIDEVDWLHGAALQAAVAQSEKLICRSGYSTLMDLFFWQKPALLIPTPGQTEQQYLAHYWSNKGWATWQEQGQIVLV